MAKPLRHFHVANKGDMNSECINCRSHRRSIYRRQLCRKCHYWHCKKEDLEKLFTEIKPEKRSFEWVGLRCNIAVAARVLDEYRWREERLRTDDVQPVDLESMLYTIAGACRSEIGFTFHDFLYSLDQSDRKLLFMILNSIVENIPGKRPCLHASKPPRKGIYANEWLHWMAHHE